MTSVPGRSLDVSPLLTEFYSLVTRGPLTAVGEHQVSEGLNITVLARDTTVLARDTTVLARDTTVLARDTTVLARDTTVLARDTTVLARENNF